MVYEAGRQIELNASLAFSGGEACEIAWTAQDLDSVRALIAKRTGVQEWYPLTSLQEGMLFHCLLNRDNDTYILSALFKIEPPLSLDVFVYAIQTVIARHDALRTSVLWEGVPRPFQIVHRNAVLPVLKVQSWNEEEGAEAYMRRRLRPEGVQMRLDQAPLVRLEVLEEEAGGSWFAMLRVHHLMCDHQSLQTIVAETIAILDGRASSLPAVKSYRTYVESYSRILKTAQVQRFFWDELHAVDWSTSPFGVVDVRRSGGIDEGAIEIDASITKMLRKESSRSGVSVARLVHAMWALVVGMLSNQEDVVFGTVLLAANRSDVAAGGAVGLFINTLPIRITLSRLSVGELIEQTSLKLSEIIKRRTAPLTLAQRCSGLAADTPLFTSVLNFRHSQECLTDRAPQGINVLGRGEAWTNYPLTVTVDDHGDRLVLMIKAALEIGAGRVLRYCMTTLESLLSALECTPEKRALSLGVLPATEQRSIVHSSMGSERASNSRELLHELIEEQAAKSPDSIAISGQGDVLTYKTLNSTANKIARYLIKQGVRVEQTVALHFDRGTDMIVGMLAVLKSGAAYIPLDSNNPAHRLRAIIDDSRPALILTRRGMSAELVGAGRLVSLESIDEEIEKHSPEDSPVVDQPQRLAYVIYTSGSTGQPKGVMVEHRNIVNYTLYAKRQFDVPHGSGSLLCTSLSFDLGLTGVYPVLSSGKTINLCRETKRIPMVAEELADLKGLAPLKLTPSHLSMLEPALTRGELEASVSVLVVGGEKVSADALRLWSKFSPETKIFNHYGPTETTVGSIVYEVTGGSVDNRSTIPIGEPIDNSNAYVLSSSLQLLPAGVRGEIYIGGYGVSRGYFGRPQQTAERFIPDPFSKELGSRMYRTGDIGCRLSDGTIEYWGRGDDQVKVRGFRVEPGEVERALLGIVGVHKAAVIARRLHGENRLMAYVVVENNAPDVLSIRRSLTALLPDYLIPSAIMIVSEIPLSPNGKLDRAALPDAVYEAEHGDYREPSTEFERALAGIWCDVLKVKRVGIMDNFFELGGHSITAMQLISRIRSSMDADASLEDIFDFPVLQEFAARINKKLQ